MVHSLFQSATQTAPTHVRVRRCQDNSLQSSFGNNEWRDNDVIITPERFLSHAPTPTAVVMGSAPHGSGTRAPNVSSDSGYRNDRGREDPSAWAAVSAQSLATARTHATVFPASAQLAGLFTRAVLS